jgi:hypothetical protein
MIGKIYEERIIGLNIGVKKNKNEQIEIEYSAK